MMRYVADLRYCILSPQCLFRSREAARSGAFIANFRTPAGSGGETVVNAYVRGSSRGNWMLHSGIAPLVTTSRRAATRGLVRPDPLTYAPNHIATP